MKGIMKANKIKVGVVLNLFAFLTQVLLPANVWATEKESLARVAENGRQYYRVGVLTFSESSGRQMNIRDAQLYCRDLGGRLPTAREYQILSKAMSSSGSYNDYNSDLIPDMAGHYFWTDSTVAGDRDGFSVYFQSFNGSNGLIETNNRSQISIDLMAIDRGQRVEIVPPFTTDDVRCVFGPADSVNRSFFWSYDNAKGECTLGTWDDHYHSGRHGGSFSKL
jgi:hypothetical protein